MYLLTCFSEQKFQNIFLMRVQSYDTPFFWRKMAHLSWNRHFGKKLVIWFWSTSWSLSLCTSSKKILEWIQTIGSFWIQHYWSASCTILLFKIFKKSLEWIHSYEDSLFLGSKWLIDPNRKKFSEKVAVFFWSTHCHLFFISLLQYMKENC